MSDTTRDRLEIHELFGRYYTYVDAHDADRWTALWADDGVFDSGHFHFEGRAALHAFMAQHTAETRHLVTNLFADVEGDRARAEHYMLVVPSTGRAEVIATAHCRTELRRQGGAWRITRHIYQPDPSFVPPGIAAGAKEEMPKGVSRADEERNKEVVRRATAELWGKRDVAAVDRYFAPNYVQHNPHAAPGREGVKRFFEMMVNALADMEVTLEHLYAEGDRVFAFMSWTGTSKGPIFGAPPTGKKVTIRTAEIHRLERGLIAEHWDVVDGSGLAPT